MEAIGAALLGKGQSVWTVQDLPRCPPLHRGTQKILETELSSAELTLCWLSCKLYPCLHGAFTLAVHAVTIKAPLALCKQSYHCRCHSVGATCSGAGVPPGLGG